jgi:hypothetical protein
VVANTRKREGHAMQMRIVKDKFQQIEFKDLIEFYQQFINWQTCPL